MVRIEKIFDELDHSKPGLNIPEPIEIARLVQGVPNVRQNWTKIIVIFKCQLGSLDDAGRHDANPILRLGMG